jgi:hypothetical protein
MGRHGASTDGRETASREPNAADVHEKTVHGV